jgi:DNA-binding PadR family transcriptional regulator
MTTIAKAPPGLEHALLGFLRDAPTHAYDIHARLAQVEALGLVWRLKQGHLYALLARLEEEGYIAGTMQPQGTRPPRRVLSLTAAGREAFAQWLVTPVAHGRDLRLEFLAKLFFAAREGPATVAALVAAQRAQAERWRADLRRQADALPADRRFERVVLGFRGSQIEAILHWLDDCQVAFGAAYGAIP